MCKGRGIKYSVNKLEVEQSTVITSQITWRSKSLSSCAIQCRFKHWQRSPKDVLKLKCTRPWAICYHLIFCEQKVGLNELWTSLATNKIVWFEKLGWLFGSVCCLSFTLIYLAESCNFFQGILLDSVTGF